MVLLLIFIVVIRLDRIEIYWYATLSGVWACIPAGALFALGLG